MFWTPPTFPISPCEILKEIWFLCSDVELFRFWHVCLKRNYTIFSYFTNFIDFYEHFVIRGSSEENLFLVSYSLFLIPPKLIKGPEYISLENWSWCVLLSFFLVISYFHTGDFCTLQNCTSNFRYHFCLSYGLSPLWEDNYHLLLIHEGVFESQKRGHPWTDLRLPDQKLARYH